MEQSASEGSGTSGGAPGVRTPGFVYRSAPEDFEVEELPLAEPEGEGEHLWLWIEKRGIATPRAEERLARRLGVERRRIGRAGIKDAVAVTRQALTVHDPTGELTPERVSAQDGEPDLRVLRASRCARGLRPGQLAGNRFTLKLREVTAAREVLDQRLAELAINGVPARFGPQRYGARGDADAIGFALLRGDADEAVALACGRPGEHDHGPVREARALFDAGDARGAAELFPASYGPSARLARAVASNRGRAKNALRALRLPDLQLWIDAAQSRVFDAVVEARAPELGRLLAGDLARPLDGGRDQRIDDPARWQAAADAFELSPTGPLPGARVPLLEDGAGEIERRAFEALGLEPELFEAARRYRVRGTRRPLRLRMTEAAIDASADDRGPHVQVRFSLPPGGYASVVLEELGAGDSLTAM